MLKGFLCIIELLTHGSHFSTIPLYFYVVQLIFPVKGSSNFFSCPMLNLAPKARACPCWGPPSS